ncbi:hypothetical protein L2E82_10742 [Cichorium intybus]|uniref:Uncharacterized protein n=1 Tax=Cichorium intybus TaxID=13427 RepID=A0ACB9GCF8_CICIN|nr:hypothetical protein L2E82_10742 [Cichorium intybus]
MGLQEGAIARGLREVPGGGGAGNEDERSLVKVPKRPPIAAHWRELVAVTTAASTVKSSLRLSSVCESRMEKEDGGMVLVAERRLEEGLRTESEVGQRELVDAAVVVARFDWTPVIYSDCNSDIIFAFTGLHFLKFSLSISLPPKPQALTHVPLCLCVMCHNWNTAHRSTFKINRLLGLEDEVLSILFFCMFIYAD